MSEPDAGVTRDAFAPLDGFTRQDGGPIGSDAAADAGTDAPGTCSLGCSGHGACELIGGAPWCRCFPGFIGDGSDCAEGCVHTSGTLDIEVHSALVHGAITINGAPPDPAGYDDTYLLLARADFSDMAHIADFASYGGPVLRYEARVAEGTYDLYLATSSSNTDLPSNRVGLVRRGVEIHGDTVLDVDVHFVHVRGSITVNGAHASGNSYVGFYGPSLGAAVIAGSFGYGNDQIRLGSLGDRSFDRRVMPGTYTVAYWHSLFDGGVPGNDHAEIGTAVIDDSTTTYDVDVPSVAIAPSYSVDGAPLTDGHIILQGAGSLGAADGYSAAVIPGSYSVIYRDAALDPRDLSAGGPVNIDFHQVRVSGRYTLSGTDPGWAARLLEFRQRPLGAIPAYTMRSILATSTGADYDVQLVAGLYDVTIDAAPFLALTRNETATASEVRLDTDRTLDVDLSAHRVTSLDVMINGSAPASPACEEVTFVRTHYDDGGTLRDAPYDSGFQYYWSADLTSEPFLMADGTYDVYFESCGGNVPTNDRIRVASDLLFDSDAALSFGAQGVDLRGAIFLDGREISDGDHASLLLGRSSAPLHSSASGGFDSIVAPGTYEIRFTPTPDVVNTNAYVGCVEVATP